MSRGDLYRALCSNELYGQSGQVHLAAGFRIGSSTPANWCGGFAASETCVMKTMDYRKEQIKADRPEFKCFSYRDIKTTVYFVDYHLLQVLCTRTAIQFFTTLYLPFGKSPYGLWRVFISKANRTRLLYFYLCVSNALILLRRCILFHRYSVKKTVSGRNKLRMDVLSAIIWHISFMENKQNRKTFVSFDSEEFHALMKFRINDSSRTNDWRSQ